MDKRYRIPFKKHILFFVLPLLLLSIYSSCTSYKAKFPTDREMHGVSIIGQKNYVTIRPTNTRNPDLGIIFYPGGRVGPKAYLPILSCIARKGYPVFLVSMPFDLAVLAPQRASIVINRETDISSWVLCGHSLGGAMAARFVKRSNVPIAGLVLLAAYPAESDSLHEKDIPVLSIYASEDGLATSEEIAESRELLPEDTIFYEIPGGNHAQFGSYGPQKKDGTATISREKQHHLITERIEKFLRDHILQK